MYFQRNIKQKLSIRMLHNEQSEFGYHNTDNQLVLNKVEKEKFKKFDQRKWDWITKKTQATVTATIGVNISICATMIY
jgi:hypothetical protein